MIKHEILHQYRYVYDKWLGSDSEDPGRWRHKKGTSSRELEGICGCCCRGEAPQITTTGAQCLFVPYCCWWWWCCCWWWWCCCWCWWWCWCWCCCCCCCCCWWCCCWCCWWCWCCCCCCCCCCFCCCGGGGGVVVVVVVGDGGGGVVGVGVVVVVGGGGGVCMPRRITGNTSLDCWRTVSGNGTSWFMVTCCLNRQRTIRHDMFGHPNHNFGRPRVATFGWVPLLGGWW